MFARFITVLAAVLLATTLLGGPAAAADPDPGSAAIDRLLVLLGERLQVSADVARHKWNRGAAVADPAREDVVVAAARSGGEAAGLTGDFAADVMRAQIEASKLVQSDHLMLWRAEGRGPFSAVPDLATQIRPRLDAIGAALMPALAVAVPQIQAAGGDALLTARAAVVMAEVPVTVRAVALRPLRPVPAGALAGR